MSMLETAQERWSSAVSELVIGATAETGGTRGKTVTIGGARGLPFVAAEAGCRPVVAMEIQDVDPVDWPEPLREALGPEIADPADWARKCEQEFGAELICLKLAGIHPDAANRSADEAAATVKAVLEATTLPLIIWGCENDEKDNEVLPRCSQAAAGENCLMGVATESNYKTLVASCLADGHAVIGLSTIDINIAKQLNILISEMGFPTERIVMYQTTGALGYGLEYTYSIQERGRLAALTGDRMMALPVICMVGQEAWRAKESKATADEQPTWGDPKRRGALWEYTTATVLLQAGSDIMVMRHPDAVASLKTTIGELSRAQ